MACHWYVDKGRFFRVFNAMRPSDDPVNNMEVPAGYTPLVAPERRYTRLDRHLMPGPVFSKTVKSAKVHAEATVHSVGGGLKFECTEEKGAFCMLKDPASSERLTGFDRRISNYMVSNYKSWIEFAQGPDYEMEEMDETKIMFVHGWVKTTEWVLGAITQNGRSAELSFNGNFTAGSAQVLVKTERRDMPRYNYRAGPRDPPQTNPQTSRKERKRKRGEMVQRGDEAPDESMQEHAETQGTGDILPRNQCIFLNYFKLKKRFLFPGMTVKAAAGDSHDFDNERHDEGGAGAGKSSQNPGTEEVTAEQVPKPQQPYDPVCFILDYILEQALDAEIAIANDRDFISLCGNEDLPDDIPAFLRSKGPQIEVTEDGVGMLLFDDFALPESTGPTQASAKHAGEAMSIDGPDDAPVTHNGPASANDEPASEDGALKEVPKRTPEVSSWTMNNNIGITALAYTHDGTTVVSGSEDGTITIRNADNGQVVSSYNSHNSAICTLMFSPDGTKLISGARDGVILIWSVDPNGWTVLATVPGEEGSADTVAWSPDSQTIATGSADFSLRLIDAEDGHDKQPLREHDAMVLLATFSPDGTLVGTTGADCVACIWDVATGTKKAELRGHEGIIYSLSFAPDGNRVLTGADDGSARIWKTETGEELVTLREHAGAVWTAVFSLDGKRVLTAAGDGLLKVCDSFTGEVRLPVEAGEGVCTAVFSDDRKYGCAVAGDHIVKVWSMETGRLIAAFEGHEDSVNIVRFSPGSKKLVSVSDDGTLKVWHIPEESLMVE